jgi:hypothetical protein
MDGKVTGPLFIPNNVVHRRAKQRLAWVGDGSGKEVKARIRRVPILKQALETPSVFDSSDQDAGAPAPVR